MPRGYGNRRSGNIEECKIEVVLRQVTLAYLRERSSKCKLNSISAMITEIVESWVADDKSRIRLSVKPISDDELLEFEQQKQEEDEEGEDLE